MKASDLTASAALLSQLNLLQSRLGQVPATSTFKDLFSLLDGALTLSGEALASAQGQVTQYLQNAIADTQAKLTAMGMDYTQ